MILDTKSSMKSSKVENILNYNQPLEDIKPVSPLTYYQPFQSTFDPEFAAAPLQTPPQMKIWRTTTTERPIGGYKAPWDHDVLNPSSSASLAAPPTLTWTECEKRSLRNSTWRGPVPGTQRPPVSGYEDTQTPTMRVMGGEGAYSLFPPVDEGMFKGSGNCRPCGLGRLEGSSCRTGGSSSGVQSYNGSRSNYYPLLGSLGRNITQNINKSGHTRPMVCNFCKNNKEVPDIYLNHYLYDPETKILSCPVLRKHVCEICGGTGDQAHTLQYCPVNRERGLQAKVPVLLKTRTITNSTGKIRRN